MTATDILANSQRFSDETRELTPAQELDWYRSQLTIDEPRLLRLLGYTPAAIAKRKSSFAHLAEARPEQTLWVLELFRELSHQQKYDVGQMSKYIRWAAETPEPDEWSSASPFPRPKARPLSPEKQTTELINKIWRGGPDVIRCFAQYLGLPSAGVARPRPARKKPVHKKK